MVFDPPRSRRRLWRWLIPLVLVAIALIALSASGAGGDRRAEIDYLNGMSDQIEQISLGGDALQEVVTRLNSIDRPEWVAVIDDLRSDLKSAVEFAQAEPPSVELFAVTSLYRLALEEWVRGIDRLGSGVLAAADNPGETDPVEGIASAIVALRAGDHLYMDLLDEIDRVDVPDPILPFRPVTLSPAEGGAITLAVSYSLAARNPDNGLALRPGLALAQLLSSPEWQLNPEDQVVMPATDEVIFSVVVTNSGNLVSAPEQVVLRISGGGDPIEISAPVAPLEPELQTTIVFDPIPVAPGESYEVTAEITVGDIDADFSDNLIQVVFRVNAE